MLLPAGALASDGAQGVEPTEPAPTWIPPPPTEVDANTGQEVVVQQGVPAGQWVFTSQYGWIWMPHGNSFTFVPTTGATPNMFVFYPTVSTHTPFSPLAPYQPDWSKMLTPYPFTDAELDRAYVGLPDYEFRAYGAAIGLFDRVELWARYVELCEASPVLRRFHAPRFHGLSHLAATGELPPGFAADDGAFERLGGREIGHCSLGSGGPEPMLARSQPLR